MRIGLFDIIFVLTPILVYVLPGYLLYRWGFREGTKTERAKRSAESVGRSI